MDKRYRITEVNICTFEYISDKCVKPRLNSYPHFRLCVIDKEKSIAIDIYHELKYDFLKTLNMVYFINGSISNIRENKRAAVQPIITLDFTNDEIIRAKKIIKKLEEGYQFKDGNDVLNNEQYLELVEKEFQEKYKNIDNKQLVKRKE